MSESTLFTVLDYLHQLGTWLVEDDIGDYGEFDHLHHWLVGELLRTFSLLGGLALLLKEVSK